MKSIQLADRKVIVLEDVEKALQSGATELVVREGAIFTPSARDLVAQKAIAVRSGASSAASPAGDADALALYHSPEAEKIKAEIIAVGRKLWQRSYVDGNGGNISYRLGPNAVLCTPTMVSKADLTPDDLCLVDLEGNQLAGGRPRTSEILMHLEIYKSNPEAKSVVHCHPPHATAYAITGRVPPTCIIPEYEVLVGRIAVSPYETPGTPKFAQTVLPFVKQHNTVLLSNHGIVCWADTVTHAEWYVEVTDTYCWTLLIASQLGAPITQIPEEKAGDLLAIKKKLGLPDARFQMSACALCDRADGPDAIALKPCCTSGAPTAPAAADDRETLIRLVTEAVMAKLGKS
ncbi:MAG TPA: class II aldolase/adducin family protein [Bryobacteraceae bacterium]|nr:class II aldolase/adducin family protein [Bryobacteraceae bacterium]